MFLCTFLLLMPRKITFKNYKSNSFNPVHATGLFSYHLKISESQRWADGLTTKHNRGLLYNKITGAFVENDNGKLLWKLLKAFVETIGEKSASSDLEF